MITKITGEQPFQVLTNNFSISPSQEGYTLQISADGENYSNLFQVGANVTRLVTGVAANSYYRLLGNQSQVSINWMKTCVTEGGSGGSGTTYTAGDYISLEGDVISVTGITPDAYLTSADTEDFATKQYVASAVTPVAEHLSEVEQVTASAYTELHTQVLELSAATEGKADKKVLVDFDHTTQAERAAVYAELKALYDGGSGATINKTYDFYKTVNTWQGQKIDYYTFSADTLVFGQVVSPENTADQVVYAQVMAIDSAGTVNVVTNTVGGVDLSGYYTSAQTDQKISAATSGKADAQNVEPVSDSFTFPNWNSQGIITGAGITLHNVWVDINGDPAADTMMVYNGGGLKFYTPENAGNAGDILVSVGSGAPVWSAMTFPTPDVTKAYVDSADTALQDQIDTMDEVVSAALVDLNEKKVESQDVKHIVKLTQAAYDQLATKDPDTFYIIVNSE